MLEISHKLVFGVILLIIITAIFMRLSTSPECDVYANETVQSLQNAINEVSTDSIKDWYSNGPPPDEKQDYYRPVMIKLCERSGRQLIESLFVKLPTYQISWGEFPTGPWYATWDESYPFSGGAMNAIYSFAMLKGGKVVGKKLIKTSKVVYRIGKIVKRIPLKDAWQASSLVKWWTSSRAERAARALFKSVAQETEEGALERFVKKEIPENYRALVRSDTIDADKFSQITKASMKELEEENVISIVKQHPVAKGRFIVNDKYIPLFHAIRDMADDNMKKYFDDVFYIPSRFNFLENMRFKWVGFKDAANAMWKTSKVYRNIVDPIKKGLRETKKKFFKTLGSEISDAELAATAREMRIFCLKNPSGCREMLKEGWNPRIESVMSDIAKRRITKETFSDTEMFKFMSQYEKWVRFEQRSTIIAQSTYKSINLKTSTTEYLKEISSMKTTEIQNILNNNPQTFESGLKKHLPKDMLSEPGLDDMIEDTRKQVVTEIDKMIVGRGLSKKEFKRAYKSAFEVMMIDGPSLRPITKITNEKKVFTSYLSYNVVNPSDFLKSKLSRQAKGLWYIKLGRYIPTYAVTNPIQALSNPMIIPGAGYASKIMENEMSTGCEDGALCYVRASTANSYLLNESAQRYAVRLWRPKPNLIDRMPIFISTGMFYPSIEENPRFYVVSPCFSMMKVWKSGGTIFISPDVDMSTGEAKKCDVQDKNGNKKAVANYCFADFKDVWGTNMYGLEDPGSEAKYYIPDASVYGWIAVILAGCTGTGPGYKACVDIASIASQAAITTRASYAAYNGDNKWGYWTYNKAADATDLVGMISGRSAGKIAKKIADIGADFSNIILALGDLSLEWPARGVNEKDKGLSHEDIYLNTGRCAWTSTK